MRNNFVKYIFIVVIAVLLIFAIYKVNGNNKKQDSASANNSSSQNQEVIKEIKVAVAGLDSINPILSKNQNVQDISRIIYEPLVNLTQDFKAEPCLATEWAKADGNSYIIKLRENVKWSNGTDFTGADVLYTIDRLKEVGSIYSYNVQHISEVDVVDDHTVKITLDSDIPFFEYNLTFPIMSKDYYGTENFQTSEKNKEPVGTGMFKISEVNDSNIVLVKNENWWNIGNKNATLEKITVNTNSSMAEVYNSFKMGNIDILNTSNLNYTDYIGTLGYTTKEYPAREHCFIAMNTQSDILSNTEVRQAIQYAIDKDNIVGTVFGGKYYTSDFPLSFGSWLNNTDDTNGAYSIENANKALQDNGWNYSRKTWVKTVNRRTQRLEVGLLVKASDQNRVAAADVIKNQLASVGITVDIQSVSDDQFKSRLASKNYDMVLAVSDVSASPDLTTYFGENNLANYNNDEVSGIMQEVKNTTDENTLKDKYKRLKEIYKTDVPYISLWLSKDTVIYTTSLAGDVNPNWYNIFYNIENWYK